MRESNLTDDKSIVANVSLTKSNDKVKADESLTLSLGFKISGHIRESFDQKNWERAYNQHDNGFRLTIEVQIKSGRNVILPLKLVRKAVLFWTRSPKIPYRIWVSVMKDDTPFYPLTIDETKGLLFDFNRVIEISGSSLKTGKQKIYADIKVYWGKHYYAEPTTISAKSQEIEITRTN